MTTAFIELDEFCYRNTFTNIETSYLNTSLPILYQNEKWAHNLIKALKLGMQLNSDTALGNFLHEEFRLPKPDGLDRNLNHISGWVYIREDVQRYFKGEYYEFGGKRNVLAKGHQWGGKPFSIGRQYAERLLSEKDSKRQLGEAERSIKQLKEELKQLKKQVANIKPENHFHIYNNKGDVAEEPEPKFCRRLRVVFEKIIILRSGAESDAGSFAEWNMTFEANGSTVNWKDDVQDGDVKTLNLEVAASLHNEQDTLRVEASGFEDDFPWLWDDLPRVSRVFGKGDVWGRKKGPHLLERGNNEFAYRIVFRVECMT